MVAVPLNEEAVWAEQVRLPLAKMTDLLLARFAGRDEGVKLGLSPVMLTRVATVISEISRNVLQHAGCSGEVRIGALTESDRRGLRMVVSDQGKGIENAERLLEQGGASALGAGLSGVQRLVDRFELQSVPGAGTVVTMEIWLKEAAR